MSWFQTLTGFSESPAQVRSLLRMEGNELHSLANGRSWQVGSLETPTLHSMRQLLPGTEPGSQKIQLEQWTGNIQQAHCDPANQNAMFQVASQFNLLEMAIPEVTPEEGVEIYEQDHTQGPACAIACGAATIYRNYFVPVGNQIGQSRDCQIDCLSNLGAQLGNQDSRLWKMKNGYALPSAEGLDEIEHKTSNRSNPEREQLMGNCRIGIQSGAQVTLSGSSHLVSQCFCSALPIAYSSLPVDKWESFARLVLDGAYELTFLAAIQNASQTGCNRVFLTLLGGGAFGNPEEWILDSIERAINLFNRYDLDVKIVSYRNRNPAVDQLVQKLAN